MPASSTRLLDSLSQFHLLDAARLDELQRDPAVAALDPKALFQELIGRGWLTPFQADHLLQGRGPELLLGSYVLADKLGEGGMGAVYKARNWKLGRTVALKVVRADRLDSAVAVERFRREIRAAAQLAHPNVVHAYDAGEEGGAFYFAMEILAGADLARVVKERGPLPVDEVCDCVRQAALGLQHAHEHGLVHRDVKPSNLLRTPQGVVKVLDLGLARLNRRSDVGEESGTLTLQGTLMGSLDYIAPEQARDSHTVDHRADLYSLGCTLYFLLAGRPPFPVGSMTEKLAGHLFEEPEPVEKVRPETPPAVAAVVRRLMAKNPEDRWQTAAEVAAVLGALLHPSSDGDGTMAATDGATTTDLPPTAAAAPAVLVPVRPPKRRRRLLVGVSVAVVLLAGLAGVLALPRRPSPTPPPAAPPASAETGELALVSLDPAVRLLVHSKADPNKGGVLRPNAPVPVAAGEYDLEIAGDALAGLRLSPPTLTVRSGERQTVRIEGSPLSAWALVSRPAWIDGVQSWTVATRTGRGAARCLAYSPDGRRLAFANEDAVVRVVDAVQARQTGAHPPPALVALVGHTETVRAVAWSHDGKTLATASWDKTVRLWDPTTGRPERTLVLDAGALAWSPDDKLLACAVGNDVLLWDVAANQPEGRLQKGRYIRALAWSADTGVLAVGDDSGVVALWTKTEGEWRSTVRTGHTKGVTSVAWAPDGKRLAAGGFDGTLRTWGDDEQPTWTVSSPTSKGYPLTVAWSPDGKTVASAGNTDDSVVRLWDAETGQAGRVFPGHSYGVFGLSWSPDGTLASAGEDRTVRFWDPQQGKALGVLGGQGDTPIGLVWSPDGSRLATGNQSSQLFLWDASSGRRLGTHPGPGGWAWVTGWSADGRYLFAGGQGGLVRRWEVDSDRAQDLGTKDETVSGGMLSPDASTLMVLHYDGSIQLTAPDGTGVRATLLGHKKLAGPPAWSPDGALVATAYEDGWVSLWAWPSGVAVQERQQKGRVGGMAWSPDGKTLAAGGGDGVIRLWDRSLSDPPTFLQHKDMHDPVSAAAWERPPGKGLYSIGDDRVLRLWDVESGKVQRASHPGTTSGVFSPDATRLASGGKPWTVRMWETATGRPLGTVVRLNQGWLVLSADGYYRCENAKVEDELVYVVQTDAGQQTLTPQEFAAKYGRKNDPEKARLDAR